MSFCVILGSAFSEARLAAHELTPERVKTRAGDVCLYRAPAGRDAFVLFRHGLPHTYLPNQIPYRAQALALREVGCQALLVTSSVGILDVRLPLGQPLLAGDLLMTDNCLPDGSACTLFSEPGEGQGHLVVGDQLFSAELGIELERLAGRAMPRVVFGYVGGPRTKTPAENRAMAILGAQVNSMTVGPEVVLAAELGIPVAALLVGHKHSGARDGDLPESDGSNSAIARSLVMTRAETERLAWSFLTEARPVSAVDRLFRYGQARDRD